MRFLITVLSLVACSFSVFAVEKCNSIDLNSESQRISKIKGITDAEREYVFSRIKNFKFDEILSCAAKQQPIAKVDSDFAIELLTVRLANRLAEIEKGTAEIEALLLDPTLEQSGRNIILKSLAEPPRKASVERQQTRELIDQILALTINS